jgi:transmembrane sensor
MKHRAPLVPLRTRELREVEASNWLAKLDRGALSEEERSALKHWLAQDPEHGRTLRSYCSMWSEMDSLLNALPANGEPVAEPAAASGFVRRYAVAALAVVCLCALGLGWFWQSAPQVAEATLLTGVGVQKSSRLGDGSVVHLNTNSIVKVEYSDAARIVRLLQGEAKFDVAHDTQRPFIVYADNSQVKAVGTEFVVRLTSQSVVVTVTDGKVQLSKRQSKGEARGAERASADEEVRARDEVLLVSKGEGATVSQADDGTPAPPKKLTAEEMKRQLGWLDGQLVFSNERLEDVIAEINRYIPNHIVIEDDELRDMRISGRFKIGDSEAMFDAIETSFDVRMERDSDSTVRVSREK